MANVSFGAQVEEWVKAIPGAVEAVFKESVQDLVSEVQKPRKQGGRMPVVTGFLRGSLLASTSQMPSINPAAKPGPGAGPNSFAFDAGQVELVIMGADLGQTIYLGYTAAYAAHREYGANGQPGDGFVRMAAQRWPSIVARVEARLKARAGL